MCLGTFKWLQGKAEPKLLATRKQIEIKIEVESHFPELALTPVKSLFKKLSNSKFKGLTTTLRTELGRFL